MHEIANRVKFLGQRRFLNRALFRKYRRYMSCGIYHLERFQNKALWNKDFFKMNSYKGMARIVLYGFFVVPCSKGEFSANALMVRSDKSVKLFDDVNKKVLTIYKDDAINCVMDFARYMGEYINNPILEIKEIDHEPCVIEQMIENEIMVNDLDKINWIYQSYNRYFSSLDISNMPKAEVRSVLEKVKKNYPELVRDAVESMCLKNIINDSFICVMSHGDVKMDNILCDKKGYYLIDYDFCESEIYFYDLLFPLVEIVILRNDDTILNEYFKGTFDSDLSDIFSYLGENYRVDWKIDYVYLCLLIAVKKLGEHNIEIDKDTKSNIQKCMKYIENMELTSTR